MSQLATLPPDDVLLLTTGRWFPAGVGTYRSTARTRLIERPG